MSSQPSHFRLDRAIRPNILSLEPYRCARDDYDEGILLDANENAMGHSLSTSEGDDCKYCHITGPSSHRGALVQLRIRPVPRPA